MASRVPGETIIEEPPLEAYIRFLLRREGVPLYIDSAVQGAQFFSRLQGSIPDVEEVILYQPWLHVPRSVWGKYLDSPERHVVVKPNHRVTDDLFAVEGFENPEEIRYDASGFSSINGQIITREGNVQPIPDGRLRQMEYFELPEDPAELPGVIRQDLASFGWLRMSDQLLLQCRPNGRRKTVLSATVEEIVEAQIDQLERVNPTYVADIRFIAECALYDGL